MAQAANYGPARHLDSFTGANGRTMVHQAARHGPCGVLSALLEAGCVVDARDAAGTTPLMLASGADQAENVQLLLDYGADKNAACADGVTPLHHAAREGAAGAARVLLAAGANPVAACSNFGSTPLHWAANLGHIDVMRVLLDAGVKPRVEGDEGMTPLWAAAKQGFAPAVRLLLEVGARVDVGSLGSCKTPLWAAVASTNPQPEVLRLLLTAGADVTLVPEIQGGTAKLLAQLWKEDLHELEQARQMDPVLQEMIVKVACERQRLAQVQLCAGCGRKKLRGNPAHVLQAVLKAAAVVAVGLWLVSRRQC